MLMMTEKEIRGGMCHAIYRYAKANNKYMKNYNKFIESLYLMYLDANNLYGWAMSQKLPVDGFEYVKGDDLLKFNESFIKNYIENSDNGYIFEADVEYLKKIFNLHKDLPFSPERKKIEKVKKLVCSTEDKESYVIHRKDVKQTLNHGLIF